MRSLWLYLISFYQRFVSPYKGFHCAHHRLHKGDTCSNAVKRLIGQHGLWRGWPKIKARFAECRQAHELILKTGKTRPDKNRPVNNIGRNVSRYTHREMACDVPCDLPCDVSFGDCFSGGKTKSFGECCSPCDLLDLIPDRRKHRRIALLVVVMVLLVLAYWFYGRGVSEIRLQKLEHPNASLLERFTRRSNPRLRVLIEVDGVKYYSNIVELAGPSTSNETVSDPIILTFSDSPLSYQIDSLKVIDARFNVADEQFVIGQVLEEFDQPDAYGSGQGFAYKLKRRWHLW